MLHKVALLLVWMRRHSEVLLLSSIDGLREGRGSSWVISRVANIALVLAVELKVQTQTVVVVHDVG